MGYHLKIIVFFHTVVFLKRLLANISLSGALYSLEVRNFGEVWILWS